ncbi:hypothetical protein ASPZODRAFT_152740 [Penicilliopsis zonata CBS 506.65]|uniref:VPS28-domain-containing protein n=1 Tax=Penicilliopsis zonata CBS 506.65 TaxID=1073090 RepID=A0A1L9SEV3_9EURO|nr:hypothetical protein ASPZODRAFT_152740 [Penicilliopsis zonata CBS 506.65]OJJ45736.1 hypothetical protein ASPZODRAFT_152740 [Penicilliopsis zonata CBS 506.65]
MYTQRPLAYAPTPYSYTPNPTLSATINLDEEVKLASSSTERDLYESLAEIYSIIVTLDGLEKAYIKDVVTEAEYTETCTRLLKQYKSSLGDDAVANEFVDLETFKRTWGLECPRATERLRIGLPATVEQASHSVPSTNMGAAATGPAGGASGSLILTATENFITFLDALKLNMVSKDALHPLLSEVIQSVNKVTDRDFENRGKIIQWLIALNQMRATEELSEEQARELAFDIESAPGYCCFQNPATMISADNDEPLHVLDLPQIYTKPSGTDLLKALELLAIKPRGFSHSGHEAVKTRAVQPAGVTQYLTSIISSSLAWLDSDELREVVWDTTAARLSERSGRTAMPSMSRLFAIPTPSGEEFTLTLHEPSLTADNLGMKTWVSSYLLSRRLSELVDSTPQLVPAAATAPNTSGILRALELGAGTGLVGLSFAALRGGSATIHLTDLPEIVPNLAHNVVLNAELLGKTSANITTGVLDWSVPPEPLPSQEERYDLILAADPLYSPKHPKWLVDTVAQWLSRGLNARVITEMPLRDAYLPQRQEFRQRMEDIGLAVVEEGEEIGYDDWESADGGALEMVIGLLTLAAIPTVTGVALGVNEQKKANERREDARRMANFNIDVECPGETQEADVLNGKRIVLRDEKVYIDDPDPSKRDVSSHTSKAFYIEYPEPEETKHLKRGRGLPSTVRDNPPLLNWIYVDVDTYELKYGNRSTSMHHLVGPYDWSDDEKYITLEGRSAFYAVEEEDGQWAVYFDLDGDELEGIFEEDGMLDCAFAPILLKRTMVPESESLQ